MLLFGVPCIRAPQNDAAQPKRLRVTLEDAVSMRTHSVEPEYPKSALADHVSGRPVFLSIAIDKQGKVIEAAPVPRDEWPPNWSFSEDARLRDAAIQAVKQWEYKPYLLNGQPVEVETRVVVKFKSEPSAEGGVRGGSGGVIGGIIRSTARPPAQRSHSPRKFLQQPWKPTCSSEWSPCIQPWRESLGFRVWSGCKLRVSKTGVIKKLRGVSGHPILIQAALDAVKQWQYKPFLFNGEPVEAEGVVIVVFKM